MASSFKPNKRGLDQFQRELQRELNKRPVYVQANIDPDAVLPPATTVNNYSGPIVTVNGDNALRGGGARQLRLLERRSGGSKICIGAGGRRRRLRPGDRTVCRSCIRPYEQ